MAVKSKNRDLDDYSNYNNIIAMIQILSSVYDIFRFHNYNSLY